jgi:hypothetical protein
MLWFGDSVIEGTCFECLSKKLNPQLNKRCVEGIEVVDVLSGRQNSVVTWERTTLTGLF